MDLRQLASLVAVADHHTFSAAAKALFTVQSNVSAHIARLERELGVTLVDRGHGTLTEAGRVVVARARRIQAELDALRADVASLGAEVAGDVRLGLIPTTARWLLPRLVEVLQERHPKVRLVVTSATTTSLLPQLANGMLDAAVLSLPVDDAELASMPLFDEELVLVVPAHHALAQRDAVRLAEVAEHRLLLQAPGTALRNTLDSAAARSGVKLCAAAEIDGVRLIASLVLDGHGAGIVPITTLPRELSDVRAVAVRDLPRRVVGVVRRRSSQLSTPSHVVLDICQEVLREVDDVVGVHPYAAAS
jgi:LysR family hydrogen peroxide-inducible transcriptional activator